MMIEVCSKYTHATESDIQKLLQVGESLPIIGELEGCDMFIDCFTKDARHAVVVAQYNPHTATSFYSDSIVGHFMHRHNEPGVFRTLETGVPSREVKAIVQQDFVIRQNVSPIRNDEDKIIGVLIMERNIINAANSEERIRLHEKMQRERMSSDENDLFSIVSHIDEAIIYFNTMGTAVFANKNAQKLYKNLGYNDEIVGMRFDNLVLGSYTIDDVVEKKYIEHAEVKIGKYTLTIVHAAIIEDDQCIGIVILINDKTDKENSHKELILKSAAIEEIHHRVKNNLQTIVSLIRLQARRSGQVEVKKVCDSIISRIFSISITHEILSVKGVDSIDVKVMLCRMAENTKSYMMGDGFDLDIHVVGQGFNVPSASATAIAMIVNELLQNSVKHGFVGRSRGEISIRTSQGDIYSCIVVEDDGAGFIEGAKKEESLGLKLVNSLIKDKLGGSIIIDTSTKGTKITLLF